ncbi:protein scribble homolog isoform X5 [Apostichopus japonicus]|uniref:protein scribble homolog isoform X5 n=1 Tax=Stichopus japonicus TaxID=307972 RepID=UPI003AB8BE50
MFRCIPLFRACNRHVEYIDRRHGNLNNVPDDVFRYARTLEELLLDANQIRDLPKQFFRLVNLQKLGLSDNELERLPGEISHFGNLVELDISRNDIMEIPDSIRFCKCLTHVDLSGNPLSRLPPSFTQLEELRFLTLNDVSLESLPSDIGSLSNLVTLELRENLLKSMPDSISYLTKLEQLDIGSNEYEELPDTLGQLHNLMELWLDCNALTAVPSEIGNLSNLTCLDISENNLEELPEEISGLKSLTDLTLSQNCLERLPEGIGNLTELSILKVDQNRLVVLTPAVGSCENLTELIVTENLLQALPPTVGYLKKLNNLNVDRNRLTHLPSELGKCTRLGVLSLRDNRVTRLPPELGLLLELHVLDVCGNRLDWIPIQLSNCNLKALWLSENQAQPLINFQTEEIGPQKLKVLTCFLLPQRGPTESMENLLRGSTATEEEPNMEKAGEREIRFAPGTHNYEDTNSFIRHGTPHPRELKARHPKFFMHGKGREVDGHLAPHESENNLEYYQEDELRNGADDQQQHHQPSVNFLVEPKVIPPPATTEANAEPVQLEERQLTESEAVRQNVEEAAKQPDTLTETEEERHVGFALEEEQEMEDQPEKSDLKLHRRDTPHYLKNKRINLTSQTDDEAAALIHQVLAKASSPQNEQPPSLPVEEERVEITFSRDGDGLGISIAGGQGSTPFKGNDEGIFISRVVDGGCAAKYGLKVGDKVISVNESTLVDANHLDAVEVLRNAGNDIRIVVLREIKEDDDVVVVETSPPPPEVEDLGDGPRVDQTPTGEIVEQNHIQDERWEKHGVSFAPEPKFHLVKEKIAVRLTKDNNGLGFSVAGGKGSTPYKGTDTSIFISRISEGGAADRCAALIVGDKVLSINNLDMTLARHDHAVALLTSSRTIDLVVLRESMEVEHHKPLVKHEPPQFRFQLANKEDSNHVNGPSEPEIEEVNLVRTGGPLGLSIVGGIDHSSYPFGADKPGIFISKIVPNGSAAQTNLCVGDRLLKVNGEDMATAKHQDAVAMLLSNSQAIHLLVQHDPPPAGLQEVFITKAPGEKLGISIRGGNKGHPGNPLDKNDEGIFISKINDVGAAAREGTLGVGQRILEVNGQSMLGCKHGEAVRALRGAGDKLTLLVCDGYDPEEVEYWRSRPGEMNNPLSQVDIVKRQSQESINSIDREMSSEELKRVNMESQLQNEADEFEKEELEKMITVTVETPIKSSPNPSSAGAEVNPNPAGGVEDIPSPIRLDSVDKPIKKPPPPPVAPRPPKEIRERIVEAKQAARTSNASTLTSGSASPMSSEESHSLPTSPSATPQEVTLHKSALEARKEALKASRLGSSKTPEVAPRPFKVAFKPSRVSAPKEPLRIDGEKSEPESLGFKDKWKRFEEQIDEQAHSTPKSTSKKVALVSQADLNNMKVDKERKQNQVTETNENDGLSAEDRRRKILGLDPLPEAPPSPSSSDLNDAADTNGQPERPMSPSEKRAQDAEERAAKREARMKDLEDDALQAHIILETDYSKTKLRVDGSVPNGNSAPDVQITTSGGIEDIKFMDED